MSRRRTSQKKFTYTPSTPSYDLSSPSAMSCHGETIFPSFRKYERKDVVCATPVTALKEHSVGFEH